MFNLKEKKGLYCFAKGEDLPLVEPVEEAQAASAGQDEPVLGPQACLNLRGKAKKEAETATQEIFLPENSERSCHTTQVAGKPNQTAENTTETTTPIYNTQFK